MQLKRWVSVTGLAFALLAPGVANATAQPASTHASSSLHKKHGTSTKKHGKKQTKKVQTAPLYHRR
jgi:hypothetical protein